MIMRTGKCCELCHTIFKDSDRALAHFIDKHPDVAMVKLSEFIVPGQYMDMEDEE